MSTANTKPTNPKDRIGVRKVPLSTVSAPVMAEIGLAMLEGAAKYGRHNYRVEGVLASVYYDATQRHLMAWWEGQDIDPASKLSHITKAIASLSVLRDAMINGKCDDDRPPKVADPDWVEKYNAEAARILDSIPNHAAPHVRQENEPEQPDEAPDTTPPSAQKTFFWLLEADDGFGKYWRSWAESGVSSSTRDKSNALCFESEFAARVYLAHLPSGLRHYTPTEHVFV